MTVFKAINLIEKQVETCHIRLESDAAEILFILKYKNSINKTYLIPILDCEIIQTAYNKECALVKLLCQARVLGDALQNFHQNLIEITLEASVQKLLLRNYVDDTSGLSNTTRTQLAFGKGEFDRYEIGNETSITFCMKEFKSILSFAEMLGLSVNIYFEGAGRPVIFALKNPAFEVNLVLSTLSSDVESQSEATSVSNQAKSAKRVTGNKRVSKKANNKSTSRTQNKSTNKSNSTLASATLQGMHSCFMEENKERERDNTRVQANLSVNMVNTPTRGNQEANEISYLPVERNTQEEFQRSQSSSSSNIISKFNKTPISGKQLVNTVFSTITKRKFSNDGTDKRKSLDNDKCDVSEDKIPSTPPPPSKKARFIFQKCFQSTFDPRTLPGYDVILAEDSDESCNE
ncbi:cell cycle checkpoint control protein Rad9 isoform X2 [Xylocopa sonorina]